jgi:hypothetical protein
VPVEHGLANAVTEVRAMTASGALVLELDGPWSIVPISEQRVEVARGG